MKTLDIFEDLLVPSTSVLLAILRIARYLVLKYTI